MTQLANLKGIPSHHFVLAANEPARLLIISDFFQNLPVHIHIRNGKVEKIEINDQPLPVEQIEW